MGRDAKMGASRGHNRAIGDRHQKTIKQAGPITSARQLQLIDRYFRGTGVAIATESVQPPGFLSLFLSLFSRIFSPIVVRTSVVARSPLINHPHSDASLCHGVRWRLYLYRFKEPYPSASPSISPFLRGVRGLQRDRGRFG